MITEEKLDELRNQLENWSDDFSRVIRFGNSDEAMQFINAVEALWRVARAAKEIDDILEVPTDLGFMSSQILHKQINEFRYSLKALEEK